MVQLNKIRKLEEITLEELNNEKLSHQFKAEVQLHNNREIKMLENIYKISKQNPFNKAIFICGAEHRKPFKEKIQRFETTESLNLKWSFYSNQIK